MRKKNSNTSLKQLQKNNQSFAANKGKITSQYHCKFFWFFLTFRKCATGSKFQINFETADLQDIVCITLANDIKVTIKNLNLFSRVLLQMLKLNECLGIQSKIVLHYHFDLWTTDKKVVNAGLNYQVDTGSAHKIICPKYIKTAHQAEARIGFSNKGNNIAVFDKIDNRAFCCDSNGKRDLDDFAGIN